MEKTWRKDGNFWVHIPPSGDPGDLIVNAMGRIIDMGDKSKWAHASLEECIALLKEGKRWPDRMTPENTAKNRYQWWLSKGLTSDFARKIGIKAQRYTRPQGGMTRDPYIYTIACAMVLGKPEKVLNIKIPWDCWDRSTAKWRKKLIKDNRPEWRRRMTCYKSMATMIRNSDIAIIIANKKDAEEAGAKN